MKTENQQENQVLTNGNGANSQPKEEPMVPYFELLRYASPKDKLLMIIGGIAAFLNGASFPSFSIIFGDMTDSFSQTGDEMVRQAGLNAIYFIIVAAGTMLMSFIMFATWMITGENQSIEFRKRYFAAILKQEIGWFDTINPNELNSKVANETFAVQGAIGEKVPTFIMTFSMSFFGFLIGYIYGWQLALVVTATLPAISIATAIFAIIIQTSENATQKSYSDAGALAEQAINAIKTVKMLDGEDFEVEKYKKHLLQATATTISYQFGVGLAFGFLWAAMLWAYALGFWYGAKLISDQTLNHNMGEVYTVGDVMIIFFAILTGGFSLGQAGPCVQNFAKGRQAAVKMFAVLDRHPRIVNPVNPKKLTSFNGTILLKNIQFCYPNRPDQKILKGLTLNIPAGKKVALVGESGCGKSTVMQLIERFYDCEEGEVLFGGTDGINVKDLDLVDLRSRIGLVGQEPVLFATSIKENLLYGKTDATESEMIDALKKANAWDFVSKMDKGLETYVGIGGGQLSGGQKQRIAIARAILKKPQILLLDEATSALDRTNERLIQETLDEVSKGITTIVIAHRLSTIQNADLIYVVDKGVVIEMGSHQELMNLHGKYEILAKNQIQAQKHEDESSSSISSPSEKNIQDQKASSQRSVQIKMNMIDQQNIVVAVKQEIDRFQDLGVPELVKKVSGQGHHHHHHHHHKKIDTDIEAQPLPKTEEVEKKKEVDAQMGRLFTYNSDEKAQFFIGIIAALANGCTFPVFSLFLAEMITVLVESNPSFADQKCSTTYDNPTPEMCQLFKDDLKDEVRTKADRLALWFFLIGVAAQILWTFQMYFLAYVGEKLTCKLRLDTYRKLLRMPIAYFDIPKNNAGTLTSRLSVDCKLINGLTSSILGINIANVGALICGIVISFIASWQMTLIMLGLAPMSYIGGILQTQFLQGFSDLTDEAYKDSGNLIMEAVTNVRTVVSFGNEEIILGIYSKKVQLPLMKAKQRGVYAGLAFGFSQMQMFIINAIVFYVGAILCRDGVLTIEDMFKSILAITFATMSAGNNAAFAGDIGAAKNASKNIFEILDSEDEFQREQRLKKQKLTVPVQGDIHFNNLTFKYFGREKNVFENLSLTVKQGQKVAFVGPSGCGKSTLMQMLMRFYEPDQGVITINGIDITDYDIRYIRRQFGIVSQEPVLFNGTIKENIQYNLQAITMEQIENASKKANAYDFVTKNQFEETQAEQKGTEQQRGTGFDRQVGPKGAQISGGQKQRIAIARAILRDSNLLLLDEATSALDAASEQLVQDSLNKLMEGKTTVAIAHRISTIKDSDAIYVFEDGKIVEEGNYQKLVGLKGAFYRLEQGIAK
ncbi:unnamed protein product (macronuclear) [Paramecium tetraurelia]|uniref:Uncharacterized protein n=1 Tax=Paramecium tetraurelia TaxID=5888 RepID=A0C216_PARTE|nr:uncharacterized protein GSPATT00034310001 [Paramecium tetraurelia]CAK64833.1 unnamed protein product [Paramecium tetraurelia]|eukprot:XP_001432230.1 hypothetical protein (macronuclear) [Paramecium tetraurelia strain d4-2]